jgi:hypothetical protein
MSNEAPAAGPPAPSSVVNSIRTLGVVEIIFGGLGLLAWPMMWGTRVMLEALQSLSGRSSGSERIMALMWEGTAGVWMRFTLALSTVLGVVLIAAGVGVIKRRPWARLLSLGYAVVAVLQAIAGVAVNYLYLFPAMSSLGDSGDPAVRGGVYGGMFGGIFGALFGLAFPVAILIVFTRRDVKRHFSP